MSGHVQPRGDGTWRIFVDGGRDPLTGHRRRLTRTYKGTRREAEREAERFVISIRDGKHGDAATTLGALLDRWLEHAEPNLAPYTLRGYRSKIEQHIRPALGDVKLRRLTTAKLDAFYRELLRRGGKRGKPIVDADGRQTGERAETPLSAQTVRHIHTIIHRACEQARRWGWLDRNPAELTEPPTVEHEDAQLPPVADVLRILDKLSDDMRDLAWMAIISGARRGELCALHWADIDLVAGQVTIRRAISETADAVAEKATKTRKERALAIDATTVSMLTARHASQAAAALECGVPLAPTGYVFSPIPGAATPLRPSLVTKRWANAATAAAVPCRFHDLRHLMVTELLEAGFEVGGVSKRAGHASTKMTQDRYQHARRAGDVASAEHMASLLHRK